jgi:putative PIN family toxin of toxin-antitoxin system
VRAVLDPNVLIAAVLSRAGAPAELLRRSLEGEFELVVSGLLLEELERALAYPKLRKEIPPGEAAEFVAFLSENATTAPDPADVAPRSEDPGDDYLIALAEQERAILVSGDGHLLALAEELPILAPRAFLETLGPA